MHFDDRLATVLRLPATGKAIARIQFRQLIDLLGSAPLAEASETSAAAYARLDELAALIPAAERGTILREPMVRLANAELVKHLACDEPEVASAAMHASALSEAEWLKLIPALPVRARGILRHRRDLGGRIEALLERLGVGDRALPPVAAASAPAVPLQPVPAPEPAAEPERPARPELVVLEGGAAARTKPADAPDEGIGAIVRRIDAFRKARVAEPEAKPAPAIGRIAAHGVLAVDFATDAEGRVSWADGPLASGLIGASLAMHEHTASAIRHRQPLNGVMLSLPQAPALEGVWRLDAVPQFEGPQGRFVGYAGRLRRAPAVGRDAAATRADSMRQVLHELRTPANAIQVAAEIIQQQLYGPAPHEYRALAAAIAGDTAQVLAGFDELDRLVKLETGALALDAGECDLSAVVSETITRLRAWTGPRGGGLTLTQAEVAWVPIARAESARIIWRLLAALVGASTPGERLHLAIVPHDGAVVLEIDVPRGLDPLLEEGTTAQAAHAGTSPSFGMFGIGFALRLASAEAAAAGGELVRDDVVLRLTLPGLTLAAVGHTHG